MKILSNKKYNDLISKQFRGIFADVNDDNLLRENGLLYGENKELQKEIDRLNNIINELEKEIDRLLERQYESERFAKEQGFDTYLPAKENLLYVKNKLQELKGSDSNVKD